MTNNVRFTSGQRKALAELPVKGAIKVDQTFTDNRTYTWAYSQRPQRCWRLPKKGGYTEERHP